ncbi:Desumoylating isopeptidase 1, partial [Paramuricea clavata]
VSSLVSSLEQMIEKGELTENEVHQVNEIERIMSEKGDQVSKGHLQLLETLLERYEHSAEDLVLTNIVQTLGLVVLCDNIILMVCQDPVSKPVFKLAREFPRLNSPEVQCAVVELFTNICSTDAGREIFVAENKSGARRDLQESNMDPKGSNMDKQGLNVEHHETLVDHRDVIEVTVKAMLDGNRELLVRAAGLVYNISMAKVSEESALECSSAILECLRRDDLETSTVYHCLFALNNFMKISPEIVNLTNLIGIELSRFLKLSKSIEEICNELEQYLIV